MYLAKHTMSKVNLCLNTDRWEIALTTVFSHTKSNKFQISIGFTNAMAQTSKVDFSPVVQFSVAQGISL